MTKREAKKKAWYQAYCSLQSLQGVGWPSSMEGDVEPPESDADVERMEAAMEELVQHCFDRS